MASKTKEIRDVKRKRARQRALVQTVTKVSKPRCYFIGKRLIG